jgi:glycerate 2-kinase
MRVLIAFDKFKDSLSARDACTAAATALRERHRDWHLDLCPLADGGEGFCEILTAAVGGHLMGSSVTGPRGERVQAGFGVIPLDRVPERARALIGAAPGPRGPRSTVAIIEMAAASGLALLPPEERDPWVTTTYGTGELIRTSAELGVAAILLGVGGSATHDLGLGALAALGLEFHGAAGAPVDLPVPAEWPRVTGIAGHVMRLPAVRIACDVANPLLGPEGAAAVYGPQKGLRAADLARLDQESGRLGRMLCAHCGKPESLMDTPGAGAAGGIAFGLMAAAEARLLPGFELVSAWLDLEARIAAADVIITGEGRFDDSSLSGKGPGAVVARALAAGKRVHVFAGQINAGAERVADACAASARAGEAVGQNGGLFLHPISPPGQPLAQALRLAAPNLISSVGRTF